MGRRPGRGQPVNALCSWMMMSVVGIRYAAVLAVAVGFLGLVPPRIMQRIVCVPGP